MNIDWYALGMVAVVSVTFSVLFVVLLAAGIRFVSAARLKTNQGGSGTATLTAGYGLLGAGRPVGVGRALHDRAAVSLRGARRSSGRDGAGVPAWS